MAKYKKITEAEIPTGVRFDVPARHQGQHVEVAYGGFDRAEHDHGDLYKRVTDHSEAVSSPTRVEFYKRS